MRPAESHSGSRVEDHLQLLASKMRRPTATGGVASRIYTLIAESYGVIMYFHGGAFYRGNLNTFHYLG